MARRRSVLSRKRSHFIPTDYWGRARSLIANPNNSREGDDIADRASSFASSKEYNEPENISSPEFATDKSSDSVKPRIGGAIDESRIDVRGPRAKRTI
jgi:hypothetical protein